MLNGLVSASNSIKDIQVIGDTNLRTSLRFLQQNLGDATPSLYWLTLKLIYTAMAHRFGVL